MAVLSGRKMREGPSSGNDFDRIHETIYGSGKNKINKRKEVFTSDYIYMYKDDTEDDLLYDGELGINKNYIKYHDTDWCNGEKNEHHEMNRFLDAIDNVEYGSIDTGDLEDFFFGEDDINE